MIGKHTSLNGQRANKASFGPRRLQPHSLNVYYQRIWMIMNVTFCGFLFDSASIEEQRRNLLHRAHYLVGFGVCFHAIITLIRTSGFLSRWKNTMLFTSVIFMFLMKWHIFFFIPPPHPNPTLIKLQSWRHKRAESVLFDFMNNTNLFKEVFNTIILLELTSLTAFFFFKCYRGYKAVRTW